jgi:repressor LexA
MGQLQKLHPQQLVLLNLLRASLDNPLTIRELQQELGMSSTSVVQHHIEQLEKKGYLKRNPDNPRDYQILSDPERPITYLNLYGLAHCGPNGSILDGAPIDRVPIASRLIRFPAEEAFLVEAIGKSMIPKINPGDLAIVQKQKHASSGDIVVCVNDESVLIKRFIKAGEKVILHSENNEFPPFLASENLIIEGIVRGIFQFH